VLFRPDLPVGRVHSLTNLGALAAADAIQTVAGLTVGLKWPNDLVAPAADRADRTVGWRKLAGLLTETSLTGKRVQYAIVGIGINVNVPPSTLSTLAPDATSLLAEGAQPVDIPTLLGSLLQEVEQRYRALQKGNGPFSEWVERLVTLGQVVEAATPGGLIVGEAEAVDAGGALLVRAPDGALHRLTSADATLRPTA
jgi:BirA family biotin operon repressor/biotin-[acetyl-CoA-carboxylase] ligase